MKLFFMISLIALSLSHVYGQINGKIVDSENSNPIEGVHIFIPRTNTGAFTDKHGNFSLSINTPDMSTLIQISSLGYESYIVSYDALQRQSTIVLKPTVHTTEEVVISGGHIWSQTYSPIKIDKITRKTLQQTGAINMMEGLSIQPGINQIGFGPGIGKPVIRGLSFSRVLTVLQGSRFENHQWGADHGLGLNDIGINAVEVIKGPASLIYGSGAVGGVVRLLEESPARPGSLEGDIELSGNSNTLGHRTIFGIKQGFDNGLFYRLRVGQENHADYIDGSGTTIGNSRFNTNTIKSSIGLNKSKLQSQLHYTYHQQNIGIIEDTESTESLATTRNDRSMQLPFQDVKDHFLSWENKYFLDDAAVQLNLAYHFHDRNEIEDAFNEIDLGLLQHNITWDAQYQFSGSGDREYIMGFQGFLLSNINKPEAEEILIPDANIIDGGFYFTSSQQWQQGSIQVGARYDMRQVNALANDAKFLEYGYELPGQPAERSHTHTFSGFTGALGGTYQPATPWHFRANVATGFRAPDLAELYSNGPHPGTNRFEIGNADFEREQNVELDLSARWTKGNFQAEVAGFVNAVQNYIFFSPTNEQMNELTVWRFLQSDALLRGMEVSVSYALPSLPWLKLNSSYEMVYANQMADDNTALPLIPANSTKLGLVASPITGNSSIFKQPRFHINLNYTERQGDISPDELITPSYFLISAGVGSHLSIRNQKIDLQVTGNNLSNTTYLDHLAITRPFGINQMGRNIQLRVVVPFIVD